MNFSIYANCNPMNCLVNYSLFIYLFIYVYIYSNQLTKLFLNIYINLVMSNCINISPLTQFHSFIQMVLNNHSIRVLGIRVRIKGWWGSEAQVGPPGTH